MDTMGIDPEELKSAARKAEAASEQIAAVALGYGPQQLADALPGSQSATIAAKLSASWDAESSELAKAADAYGQALYDSARRYNADDHNNAAQFGVIDLDTFTRLR